MSNDLAVLVMGYSRPELIRRCILSISHLGLPSSVDVICSIDKWTSETNRASNEETVRVVRKLKKDNFVDHIIERPANLGTAQNVTQSVTEVLRDYSSVFVVEDDLEFVEHSKDLVATFTNLLADDMTSFTAYCNTSFVSKIFVLDRFSSQTWFTTGEKWKGFSLAKMKKIILSPSQKTEINQRFGSDIVRDFKSFQEGRLDTWAVPWNVFNFLEGRRMIYPCRSYVINNSHLDGAERTKGIIFPYEVEIKYPDQLDIDGIIENKKYLKHFSRLDRFTRKFKSLVAKT